MDFRDRPSRLLSADVLRHTVRPYADRLRLSALETEFVLWSAVRNRTDVEFWAEQWQRKGGGAIEPLLGALLQHKNPDLRAGAAYAVPLVAADNQELLKECFNRFVEDADATVRINAAHGAMLATKVAGNAALLKVYLDLALTSSTTEEGSEVQLAAAKQFVSLADKPQIEEFLGRVKWFSNTPQVKSLLAHLYAHCLDVSKTAAGSAATAPQGLALLARLAELCGLPGATGKGLLSFWKRHQAQKAWEEYRMDSSAKLLRSCKDFAPKLAIMATLGVLAGCGLPFLLFDELLVTPDNWLENLVPFIIAGVCFALGGGLAAWGCVGSVAKVDAIYGKSDGFQAVRRSPFMLWYAGILFVFAFGSVLEHEDLSAPWFYALLALAVVFARVLRLGLGVYTDFAARAVVPSSSLWSAIIRTSLSVLAGLILWGVIGSVVFNRSDLSLRAVMSTSEWGYVQWLVSFYLVAINFGYVIALNGLAKEGLIHFGGRQAEWPRYATVFIILIAGCTFVVYHGPARIWKHVFPPTQTVSVEGLKLSGPSSEIIGFERYRVKSPNHLLRVTFPKALAVAFGGQKIQSNEVVFLPGGRATLTVRNNESGSSGEDKPPLSEAPALVDIRPEAVPQEQGVRLQTNEVTVFWLGFEKDGQGWKSRVELPTDMPMADRDYLCRLKVFTHTLDISNLIPLEQGQLTCTTNGLLWGRRASVSSELSHFWVSSQYEHNLGASEASEYELRFHHGLARAEFGLKFNSPAVIQPGARPALLVTASLEQSREAETIDNDRRQLASLEKSRAQSPTHILSAEQEANAASYHRELGDIETAYGEIDEARADYQQELACARQASDLYPKAAAYHDDIARAEYRLEDLQSALEQWQTVEQLEPQYLSTNHVKGLSDNRQSLYERQDALRRLNSARNNQKPVNHP